MLIDHQFVGGKAVHIPLKKIQVVHHLTSKAPLPENLKMAWKTSPPNPLSLKRDLQKETSSNICPSPTPHDSGPA